MAWEMISTPMALMDCTCGQVSGSYVFAMKLYILFLWLLHSVLCLSGTVPRQVASPNAHTLAADDVVSCCLDLSVPSISFRINGHPVQGMFENFNVDGLFFPVISFSAGVK